MQYTLFPGGPTGPSMVGSVSIHELLASAALPDKARETGGAESSDALWRAWKTRLPAYSHALFQGGATAKHVTAVTGISIDQDGMPPGTVEAVCQRNDLEFYRWDTPSRQMGRKEHAYRYLIPFAEPLAVSPDDWKALWADISAMFGGTNDRQTKNIDRKMYLPLTIRIPNPKDRTKDTLISPNLIYQPGAPLDVARVTRNTAPATKAADDLIALPRPQLLRALDLVIKKTKDTPTKLALQSLKRGEEFAVQHQRHAAILTLTRVLTAELPSVSTDCLASLFEPSLNAMPDTDQTLGDVVAAIDGAREKFVSLTGRRKAALIKAARTDGLSHEYTFAERREMAEAQGLDPADLENQILVFRGREIYALTHRTGYEGPYMVASGALLQQLLAPWGREDDTKQALEHYGIAAKEVIYSIALRKSVHNINTGCLRLASAAPEVTFRPTEHKDVAAWLEAFDNPKLLDWLACAPDPHKAVCGLGIYGPKSTGKSLLAVGIARLWGNGTPANPHEVFETNFNASLARNAVLHIDEYTPNKFGRPISSILRQIIGAPRQALSVKQAQPISLEGYTRVILTGNDSLPLTLNEDIGRQSQEAIAERILAIKAGDHIPGLLAQYDAASFGLHKIAEHALWLAETRPVVKKQRFWVEGDMDEMLSQLVISNSPTASVAEWLVRFVLGQSQIPIALNGAEAGLWGQKDGRLALSVELINRRWEVFRDTRYKPGPMRIKEQLSVLSTSGKTEKVTTMGGGRKRLHVVDTTKLATLADELGICEPDEFVAALNAKISNKSNH